jgi:hypothetical protein
MNSRLSTLCFLALIIMAFAACNNSKSYILPNPPKDPPGLNVVNATNDTLDFFMNGVRQNDQSDIYPDGATYYLPVTFGTANYSFKKVTNPVNTITLFTISKSLDTLADYSLFVCGETADKVFWVNDAFPQIPSGDTLAIRFVNASPSIAANITAVDIVVNKGPVTVGTIKNSAFQAVSPYMATVDTVNEVKVYATGTTNLLADTTFTPAPGESYTFFTGAPYLPKGTTQVKVRVAIFQNQNAVINTGF